MSSELKTISDAIKPVLTELGYRRKGNTFYKVSGSFAFCVMVEHPGLYYARYYLIPLYMPQDQVCLTYGKRFRHWWDGNGDVTLFISQVIDGIREEVIPFFQQINSPARLLAFLRQDDGSVRPCFDCPRFRCSLLAAYTALTLHDSQAFHSAVSETREFWSEAAAHYTRNAAESFEAELTNLEQLTLRSDAEIDQLFQDRVLQAAQKLFPNYRKARQQCANGDGSL